MNLKADLSFLSPFASPKVAVSAFVPSSSYHRLGGIPQAFIQVEPSPWLGCLNASKLVPGVEVPFSLPTYRLASIRSLSLCTFVLTPCQEFGIDCGLLFGTWDELNANAFVKIMLGCFFTPLLQSCLNAALLARVWVGADGSPPFRLSSPVGFLKRSLNLQDA